MLSVSTHDYFGVNTSLAYSSERIRKRAFFVLQFSKLHCEVPNHSLLKKGRDQIYPEMSKNIWRGAKEGATPSYKILPPSERTPTRLLSSFVNSFFSTHLSKISLTRSLSTRVG